ncbi:MAG TPA: class IIb bacteriocin, lactobin A/cerein 7B family [Candidatus Angelobacter sp.]|jgi:bacteriocin-like protein
MSNDNNRVLTRMGARSLTENELEEISGGKLTLASVLGTGPVSNPDEILDQ